MEAHDREVKYYQTINNRKPFKEWRDGISDLDTKAAVDARIARLRGGNFSDSDTIGGGASENRIDHGPGLRIYYGVVGTELVILLCGGDKSTQNADIQRAKAYWKDYKKRVKLSVEQAKKKK